MLKLSNILLEEEEHTVNFYVEDIRGMKVVLASLYGKRIGALRLVPYKESYAIHSASVLPDFRGLGIGKKMYRVAFDKLGPFYSDELQTFDADRVWKSFLKSGQAIEVDGRYKMVQESLRDWFKKEDWVRISTSGDIAGPCGTSKNKKNPDRCLPKAKAQSLSKAERAATARKKKKAGKKGKTVVANTKKAKVTREMKEQWPQGTQSRYQEYSFKLIKVMPDRAKYSVTDMETGELKGTVVFNTVDQLHDYAKDLIKPQGGRQSSHFGTSETANTQDGKAAPYGSGYKKVTKEDIRNLIVGTIHEMQNEGTIEEKDDRCTRLAKQKYDTWPSAYASGAVVRCRRGEIWKKEK